MVTLVNYNPEPDTYILQVLNDMGVNCKATLSESEIWGASHIILPPIKDFELLKQRLYRFNLYSVFRMTKKKLLGYGSAIQLMCETSETFPGCHLAVFPEAESLSPDKNFKSQMKTIQTVPNAKLLNGVETGTAMYFDFFCGMNAPQEYVIARLAEDKSPVMLERENIIGMMFDPFCSGDAGITLLNNFFAE